MSRQAVHVDEVSIDPLSRPYDYVKALSQAQGGKCSCGKCGRSYRVGTDFDSPTYHLGGGVLLDCDNE